jgi:hypothetical protein
LAPLDSTKSKQVRIFLLRQFVNIVLPRLSTVVTETVLKSPARRDSEQQNSDKKIHSSPRKITTSVSDSKLNGKRGRRSQQQDQTEDTRNAKSIREQKRREPIKVTSTEAEPSARRRRGDLSSDEEGFAVNEDDEDKSVSTVVDEDIDASQITLADEMVAVIQSSVGAVIDRTDLEATEDEDLDEVIDFKPAFSRVIKAELRPVVVTDGEDVQDTEHDAPLSVSDTKWMGNTESVSSALSWSLFGPTDGLLSMPHLRSSDNMLDPLYMPSVNSGDNLTTEVPAGSMKNSMSDPGFWSFNDESQPVFEKVELDIGWTSKKSAFESDSSRPIPSWVNDVLEQREVSPNMKWTVSDQSTVLPAFFTETVSMSSKTVGHLPPPGFESNIGYGLSHLATTNAPPGFENSPNEKIEFPFANRNEYLKKW